VPFDGTPRGYAACTDTGSAMASTSDNRRPGQAPSRPGAQRWFFDLWSRVYDVPLVQWTTYWPVHDAIMTELRRHQCRRILDVGCGTGQLTARITQELPRCVVTGCDFSRGMLRQAAARTTAVGWVQADAGSLPFPAGTFDAVVSTEAFHWFPDQDRAAAELHRVVAPGGLLLVALVNSPTAGVASALHAASRLLGEPFYWPTTAEMRARLEGAGFHVLGQSRIFRLPGGVLMPPILTRAMRPETSAETAPPRPEPAQERSMVH
jgi:ubiquinone/menaquinone biosynthesis C-methylase UbiE